MSRTWEVARLLKAGRSPVEMAETLGLALGSVFSYLNRAVGEGLIRRSDIYFSFPASIRPRYQKELAPYAAARTAFGDMYEDLRRIETTLHGRVRRTLVDALGSDESQWWRQGVPEQVRVKCQERREKDPDAPCMAYCYTDLLDLAKVMEAGWALFKDQLPTCYSSNRRQLLEDIGRLNRIRNKVMHPVRGLAPTEEDFDFVHLLHRTFEIEDLA